jgi:hypothetical protein
MEQKSYIFFDKVIIYNYSPLSNFYAKIHYYFTFILINIKFYLSPQKKYCEIRVLHFSVATK